MHINLIPADTQLELQARVALRHWGLVWAICGAGFLAYGAWVYGSLHEAQAASAVLTARCQPLHALQTQIQSDHRVAGVLLEEHKLLNQIQPPSHLIELLGIIAQATQPEEGHLQLQRLSLLARQNIDAVKAPKPAPVPTSTAETMQPKSLATLSLQGVADSDAILASFVAGLRESGVFKRVDLKSSSQVTGGALGARQYELECRYEDQP